MMSRLFTLSQKQLKVLLAGRGYHRLMSIGYDTAELDNNTVLNTLNELTVFGFLTAEENSFVMLPELKKLIDCIGKAKCCYTVSSRIATLPDKCIFAGETPVCCTVRAADSGHTTLSACTWDAFVESLFDEGYLPPSCYEMLPDADLSDYEAEIKPVSRNRILSTDSPVILSIESDGGRSFCRLQVIDHYLTKYILYESRDNTERKPYSPEVLKLYLKKMVKNDYCGN